MCWYWIQGLVHVSKATLGKQCTRIKAFCLEWRSLGSVEREDMVWVMPTLPFHPYICNMFSPFRLVLFVPHSLIPTHLPPLPVRLSFLASAGLQLTILVYAYSYHTWPSFLPFQVQSTENSKNPRIFSATKNLSWMARAPPLLQAASPMSMKLVFCALPYSCCCDVETRTSIHTLCPDRHYLHSMT